MNQSPVFLIATSAAEVGFDSNADHMVCDATTIDSLTQRLGRVNRRGMGDAQIRLVVEPVKKEKDGKPKKREGLEVAIANTVGLLQSIPDGDVSPKNIAALKIGRWKDSYAGACSPDVPTVELTDILLDAWSMTSITELMPARPEVGPWLRGIDDELPQTTIAWRAELELVKAHPDPAVITLLQRHFSKHPVRPHESITTYSYRVVEFLKQACKLKGRPNDLLNARVALRLSRGKIVLRTIKELADDPSILNAEPTLILPATFGGLDAAGILDAEAIPTSPKADDSPSPSLDVADCAGYEQREDAPPRLRLLILRTEEGRWAPASLPGGVAIGDRLQIDDEYATSTALFADLHKCDLRIRFVQPIAIDNEGDAVQSLVMLSPVSKRGKPEDQSLDDHVGAVEAAAERIADALELAEDDPVRVALLFAARWHDEGKKAEVWQRFVYGEPGEYKGKSPKMRDPKSLGGYRHEFGSLLRLIIPAAAIPLGRCQPMRTRASLPCT
jgi:CRISPR-associated endonuclease/helicase Cas3